MNYYDINGVISTPRTENMAYEQTNHRIDTLEQNVGERIDITDDRLTTETNILHGNIVSEVSKVNSRIDNIIANSSDTDNNSELIDIRISDDGTIYRTAGEAIRTQFEHLSLVSIGVNKLDPERLSDGRYQRSTQTGKIFYQSNEDYICSDFIPITDTYCTTGCKYNNAQNTIRSGYALFNENFDPIDKNESYTYTIITISSSNAKYIRVWWKKDACTAPYFVGFSDNANLLPYTPFERTISMPNVDMVSDVSISQMNTNLNRLIEENPDTTINRVCCWGDSLTYGSGTASSANTYPKKLLTLLRNNGNTQFDSSYGVLNNGNAGGGAEAIAAYQGGVVLNVKPAVIPAQGSVQIELEPFLGNSLNMMKKAGNYITSQNYFGYANNGEKMNPCYIAGVEGNLFRDTNGNYIFTRTQSGEAVSFDRPVPLITYGAAELNNPTDCAVIWAGTNDTRMDIDEIAGFIKLMVDNLNNDKYIILGLTAKNYHSDIESKNRKLGLAFGKHFLDVRTYILNYGLQDENITATPEDTEAISQGFMPPSLMHDSTHFNDYGYDIIANQVYLKGKLLGYWG